MQLIPLSDHRLPDMMRFQKHEARTALHHNPPRAGGHQTSWLRGGFGPVSRRYLEDINMIDALEIDKPRKLSCRASPQPNCGMSHRLLAHRSLLGIQLLTDADRVEIACK